ncbi:hypothetical protein ACNKHQ_04620 [Shigella flexneri]
MKIRLKRPVLGVYRYLWPTRQRRSFSPAALKKYGNEIGFHPVGTGPYKLDILEPD